MTRTLTVALLTLGDTGQLTGGYLYHRRLAELAPRFDARLEFVSFPERPFPLAVIDAREVLRQARALGAQALVLDSIVAAFAGPWMLTRRPDLPLLGMLHQPPGGIDHGPVRTAVQRVLDRLAYRSTEQLLVASDDLANQLTSDGITTDRLLVVPPGRDVAEVIGPSPGDLRQGRQAAFLCVGNWVERKGILYLLDALAQLPPEAATLHLAGNDQIGGQYAEKVRARLAQPDITDRVVIHGPVPVETVAALYQAADAFVLPSFKEPYGTVYGEAMAFELPVVGWRAGNLPYLASDEQEGLLADPGDTAGLAYAMRRLASDEALRLRLGAAARQRALTRPTWDETAELFFNTIRAAVEQYASSDVAGAPGDDHHRAGV